MTAVRTTAILAVHIYALEKDQILEGTTSGIRGAVSSSPKLGRHLAGNGAGRSVAHSSRELHLMARIRSIVIAEGVSHT